MEKSRIARERKSRTPRVIDRDVESDVIRYQITNRQQSASPVFEHGVTRALSVAKERSLSPYSRRLALTQSMNMVR